MPKNLHVAQPIADGVWMLPGSEGSETIASCVLLADGQATVLIDPGPRTASNLHRLQSALEQLGRAWDSISTLLITHSHSDHAGIADDLRGQLGARVVLHRADLAAANRVAGQHFDPSGLREHWGVASDDLWQRLSTHRAGPHGPAEAILNAEHPADGSRYRFESSEWEVVATPGHTPGHVCLVNDAQRIVVLGDHVLPDQFPGVGLSDRGDAPVRDYLDSLHRLEGQDSYRAVPGHGAMLDSLGDRRRATVEHVERRAAEVDAVLAQNPHARAAQIAPLLHWTAGWSTLSRSRWAFSALWQVDLYRNFVISRGQS